MAISFILKNNLGTITVPRNIALNGIPQTGDASETQKLRWGYKWRDETGMEPQLLGDGVAGQPFTAPFDTQGREAIFFVIGYNEKGQPNASHFRDAEQFVYVPPTPPTLSDATFSTPDIDLTFIANGGTGNIQILRRTGTDDFAVIAEVPYSDTTYSDTPPLNGTYDYKLTQTGLVGESNVRSATKTGGSSGSGSPSTDLAAVYDDDHTVALTWTSFGTGGTYTVERKKNSGSWSVLASGLGSNSYNDTDAAPERYTKILHYRVSKTTVTGYTNESDAEITGLYS